MDTATLGTSDSDDGQTIAEQINAMTAAKVKALCIKQDEQIKSLTATNKRQLKELTESIKSAAAVQTRVDSLSSRVKENDEALHQSSLAKEEDDRTIDKLNERLCAAVESLSTLQIDLEQAKDDARAKRHEVRDMEDACEEIQEKLRKANNSLDLEDVKKRLHFDSPGFAQKSTMIPGSLIRAKEQQGRKMYSNPYQDAVDKQHAAERSSNRENTDYVQTNSNRTAKLVKSKLMKDKDSKLSSMEISTQEQLVNSTFLSKLFKILQSLNVICLASQAGHTKEFQTLIGRADEMEIYDYEDYNLLDKHYGTLFQQAQ
jgi:FtsZ-binding cell division protein ZapB